MTKTNRLTLLILLGLFFSWQPLMAGDDVLTTIEEAVRQYKSGDYAGAASNLDYASQLVRQKKNEAMKELLPEPLAGWTAEAANAQAIGTAIFGGAITVNRDYKKGSALVNVEIVSDSPVLQSVILMINNPLFAGGGKLDTINGQKAIIKYDGGRRGGDVTVVVAGHFMVTVKGHHVERDDLVNYARAVDYQALAMN
ncbi:MAG: hypothetical protein GQ559_10465 [Desulfobulbaceae bacterium]|nr:hypothetical protein [Desulfobulbaceae bacterium]